MRAALAAAHQQPKPAGADIVVQAQACGTLVGGPRGHVVTPHAGRLGEQLGAAEALGGLSTFLTMSYILFVNPAILSAAGMPFDAVAVATALAAALTTIAMGVFANAPFALASGLGLNAVVGRPPQYLHDRYKRIARAAKAELFLLIG